jgi:hypothetical protein
MSAMARPEPHNPDFDPYYDDYRTVATRLGVPKHVIDAVEADIDGYAERYKAAALTWWNQTHLKHAPRQTRQAGKRAAKAAKKQEQKALRTEWEKGKA